MCSTSCIFVPTASSSRLGCDTAPERLHLLGVGTSLLKRSLAGVVAGIGGSMLLGV
jgi:hypothetical protein